MKGMIVVMKKFLCALIAVSCSAAMLSACSGNSGKVTLNVYNWGEYISDGTDGGLDVISEFEKKYPEIRVNYTKFDQNESMYAKIKSGGGKYDVVIPSDYMINRMIKENMLEKLDYGNIPNYKNIMKDFKSSGWDYDEKFEYSVPYTWGTVGIVYNKKMVTKPVDSWDILWDGDYSGKILMFDNPRDAFGIAAKKLGYSQNTTDKAQIEACAQALKQQKPLVQAYVMDQVFDKMISGEAAVAPYYAGDAVTMIKENPDLDFVIPKEGSNKFVDAMVVPAGTQHKKEAETFINFMCEREVAKANIEYINYSTPLTDVKNALDDEVKNNRIIYPDSKTLKNCEVFKYLPEEINKMLDSLWIEVKAS